MKLDSEIIVRGEVLHLKESKNERGHILGYTAQLMKRGQKGYDLLNIRLPEGSKPENYKEGTSVELAVDYSVFENSVFFRATRDLRTEARGSDRSAPPTTKTA